MKAGDLDRLESEIAFLQENSYKKLSITIPIKTYKSYKGLKGPQFTFKSWIRVISGVLAILIVSVHIYQSPYLIVSLCFSSF